MKLTKMCVVLRTVQATTLVVAALTSLLQVHSLPLSARPGSDYNNIIDVALNSPTKDLPDHMYSDREAENGIVHRVARDTGLVWENETAGGVIYHANEREYRLIQILDMQLHACMFMQEKLMSRIAIGNP